MSDFDDIPAPGDGDAPPEEFGVAPDGPVTMLAPPPVVAAPFAVAPDITNAPDMAVAPDRNANDIYALAALICALAGFLIPILPSAAALMLVRATEEPIARVPLSPSAQKLAATAQTLAYVSLTLMSLLCAALLLGILGRVIS